MRPDNKFTPRQNTKEGNSLHVGGSDSKYLTVIGHPNAGTTTFGGPDSLRRPNPHTNTVKKINYLGRIDRGQPLYHGGFDPDEDDYGAGEGDGVEFEFEKEINSLELKKKPDFSKKS